MKGTKMSINQFVLIVCDAFSMDTGMPPLFGKWRKQFGYTSYKKWAIDEIVQYVTNSIYPRTRCSVDELLAIISEFRNKASEYSQYKARTHMMFRCAVETANDIIDLLYSMN